MADHAQTPRRSFSNSFPANPWAFLRLPVILGVAAFALAGCNVSQTPNPSYPPPGPDPDPIHDAHFRPGKLVHVNHQLSDRRVECKRFNVFGYFLDRGVHDFLLRRRQRLARNGLRQLPPALLILLYDQAPDPREKPVNAFDAAHAPRFGRLQRPHKHFVKAQGIRAVVGDHIVRVNHVAAAFRHFVVILAEDHALIHQALKRLDGRNVTQIVKHLVPESRVQEVEHGVLGTADVMSTPPGLPPDIQ